jgi:hypothetical protein
LEEEEEEEKEKEKSSSTNRQNLISTTGKPRKSQ